MIDIGVTILYHGNKDGEGAFSLAKIMKLPTVPAVGATLEFQLGDKILLKQVEKVVFSEDSSDIELYLESEFNPLFPDADKRIAKYQDFGWEKALIDSEFIVGDEIRRERKKKIHILHTLKSDPDVAAIEFGGSAGFVALSELRNIVEEGIQDRFDIHKSLVPANVWEHNDICGDEDIICLTLNVSGSLKTHITRLEAEQFLKDTKKALDHHESRYSSNSV